MLPRLKLNHPDDGRGTKTPPALKRFFPLNAVFVGPKKKRSGGCCIAGGTGRSPQGDDNYRFDRQFLWILPPSEQKKIRVQKNYGVERPLAKRFCPSREVHSINICFKKLMKFDYYHGSKVGGFEAVRRTVLR